MDVDASLVGSHSEKEETKPTYKRGFGFHAPLVCSSTTALRGLVSRCTSGCGQADDYVVARESVARNCRRA